MELGNNNEKLKVEDMLNIVLKGQDLSNTKPEHRWDNIKEYLFEINLDTGKPNIFNEDNYNAYLHHKKVVDDFKKQERVRQVKAVIKQLKISNIFLFIEYIFFIIPTVFLLIPYAFIRDRRQETGDRRQETGDRRQETGVLKRIIWL